MFRSLKLSRDNSENEKESRERGDEKVYNVILLNGRRKPSGNASAKKGFGAT